MLNKIYEYIREQLESLTDKNSIIIFRGFTLEFIKELSNGENYFWPLLNTDAYVDNKIYIEKLFENESRRAISLALFSNSGRTIITSEEAVVAGDNIKLSDRKLYLITNDLIDQYPNETNVSIAMDTESNVDQQKKSIENNFLSDIYAESIEISNRIFLRPEEIDGIEDDHVIFLSNLLPKRSINSFLTPDNRSDDTMIGNEEDLNQFIVNSLYYPSNLSKRYTIGSNLLNDKNNKRKITKTASILELANFSVSFTIDVPNQDLSAHNYRSEINDYVQKYWNGPFREIEFYKNPDVDNAKINISQGSIVDRIIINTENAISNKSFSDIFITAPTGAGKSLLFQLPAIYLRDRYHTLTIVISPLKALMTDQVEALHSRGVTDAEYLNSDKSLNERDKIIEKVKKGDISVLYLSPELLLSYNINYFIGEEIKIGLMVIDEAHLITTWGRDFRVDYWYLGTYIRRLRKEMKFPVACFTATSVYGGIDDTFFDTIETLDLKAPEKFLGIARRTNIDFNIRPFKSEKQYADEKENLIIEKVKTWVASNEKTLLYCPYTSQVEQFRKHIDTIPSIKDKVGYFHSNIDRYDRDEEIKSFKDGSKLVILATKAFGMGVDISDIKRVYHFAPNGTLADYVQEIGRVARDQNILGIAETDFGDKDLRYAKTLFGLSSIKKYQLELVLKKLLDRYDHKKQQNLLFAVDDFSYIFSNEAKRGADNMSQKIQSTLMLIEKDFLRRYRYNVIIARPKALFTDVYASIDASVESLFIKKYGNFVKKVSSIDHNKRIASGRYTPSIIHDVGDVYKIDLASIWEVDYADSSFPTVKYNFYNKTLFKNTFGDTIYPRYNLLIKLNASFEKIQVEFEDKLKQISNILSSDQFSSRFFSQKELSDAFQKEKISRNNIALAALFCNVYSNQELVGTSRTAILQPRRIAGIDKYRVISNTIYRLNSELIKTFNDMFNADVTTFSKYMNVEKNALANSPQIKSAYFIESLELGSYEFSGGKNPQIFVRINDVRHLRQTVNNPGYTNLLLKNIQTRHTRSMDYLEEFFLNEMTTAERWDNIEKYFLGQD